MEQQLEREHQTIVEEIRELFTKNGAAMRRPQMIYNLLYHPDLVATFDGKRFAPIEVINSNYGFDVLGMLSLVMTKDIIECGIIVTTDRMYNLNPQLYEDIQKLILSFNQYSGAVYGNHIIFLREHEVEAWIKEKMKNSELWGLPK